MHRRIVDAHPFVWAAACGTLALLAVLLAITIFADPHRSERRTFLQQCNEQAADQGVPEHCGLVATQKFGVFHHGAQNMAFAVAAVAVFAGTVFVLIYIVRRVDETVGQRR
jgi:membrane protein YdbS with pleckstrin-like domain